MFIRIAFHKFLYRIFKRFSLREKSIINSIPNKNSVETKENEKILLKERANRYTYEGKFANFTFLQRIERKVFNKKLGISFADFKKMNNKK